MGKGKDTCRQLKEIRRQIAMANDIRLVIEECTYKGECEGTCPRCEAEVRYLESQLRQRQMLGKAVMVAGLSLGVLTATANTPIMPVSKCQTTEEPEKKQGKYKITGIVVDENNDSIVGSTIHFEKDDNNYEISNIDGSFVISTDNLPQKLIFSYLGYIETVLLITEENYDLSHKAILKEDPEALSDQLVFCGVIIKKKKSWIPKFLRKK